VPEENHSMLPSEGFVTAEDGVRLFFQKLGTSPSVVIIPNAVHMFDSFKALADDHTVIFFDLRNRGRSDSVSDGSKLARGIQQDVDDLEAVRRHFGIDRVSLIGHSYQGLGIILYALKYPAHVNRLVQIGAMQPHAATQYPAQRTGADSTLAEFHARLAQLQQESQSEDSREIGKKFWALLRVLMVWNPADAEKIRWTPYQYPNELSFMRHWTENVFPSIQALTFAPRELAHMQAPVLTIHGFRDRQSPYGGGREWASMLPDARLLTVENAAHVPWIEAPGMVLGAIQTFLHGSWPEAAHEVRSMDPSPSGRQKEGTGDAGTI
jgi:proline iminopeptidase